MSTETTEQTTQIRHYISGALIYEGPGTLRDVLEAAVVARANLRGADLRGADLSEADLRGADLSEAGIPTIPDIHAAVYAAASAPGALDMTAWHTCETTHSRAGWVVTLAGEAGRALELSHGTSVAAALIYTVSDPTMERTPDWLASDEDALADMARLAGVAPTPEGEG